MAKQVMKAILLSIFMSTVCPFLAWADIHTKKLCEIALNPAEEIKDLKQIGKSGFYATKNFLIRWDARGRPEIFTAIEGDQTYWGVRVGVRENKQNLFFFGTRQIGHITVDSVYYQYSNMWLAKPLEEAQEEERRSAGSGSPSNYKIADVLGMRTATQPDVDDDIASQAHKAGLQEVTGSNGQLLSSLKHESNAEVLVHILGPKRARVYQPIKYSETLRFLERGVARIVRASDIALLIRNGPYLFEITSGGGILHDSAKFIGDLVNYLPLQLAQSSTLKLSGLSAPVAVSTPQGVAATPTLSVTTTTPHSKPFVRPISERVKVLETDLRGLRMRENLELEISFQRVADNEIWDHGFSKSSPHEHTEPFLSPKGSLSSLLSNQDRMLRELDMDHRSVGEFLGIIKDIAEKVGRKVEGGEFQFRGEKYWVRAHESKYHRFLTFTETDGAKVHQLQDSRIRDIPVIIMTGDDDLTTIQSSIDPRDILRKPLQSRLLLASVSLNLAKMDAIKTATSTINLVARTVRFLSTSVAKVKKLLVFPKNLVHIGTQCRIA